MVQTVINKAMETLVQVQIYHWLADSQQVHETIGTFYEELQKAVDELAERHLSYDGTLSGEVTFNVQYEYSYDALIDELLSCRENLIDAIQEEDNPSIEDSYINTLALIDKNIYLLGLTINKN